MLCLCGEEDWPGVLFRKSRPQSGFSARLISTSAPSSWAFSALAAFDATAKTFAPGDVAQADDIAEHHGRPKLLGEVAEGRLDIVGETLGGVLSERFEALKQRHADEATGTARRVLVNPRTYDAKAPLFAGPATTSSTVYAADLKGVVHALNLADGQRQ